MPLNISNSILMHISAVYNISQSLPEKWKYKMLSGKA
jgi:hypothetical protein